MSSNNDKIWTYTLTDGNGDSNTGIVTIQPEYGMRMVAIQGTSVAETTVAGTYTAGVLASLPLTLSSVKASITICATPGSVIEGLVITCAAGATADIIANV